MWPLLLLLHIFRIQVKKKEKTCFARLAFNAKHHVSMPKAPSFIQCREDICLHLWTGCICVRDTEINWGIHEKETGHGNVQSFSKCRGSCNLPLAIASGYTTHSSMLFWNLTFYDGSQSLFLLQTFASPWTYTLTILPSLFSPLSPSLSQPQHRWCSLIKKASPSPSYVGEREKEWVEKAPVKRISCPDAESISRRLSRSC